MDDCSTKTCSECGETKPLDEFNKHAGQPDGRQLRCRSCFSRYNKKRYESKGDSIRSAIYSYREANPQRVLVSRLSTCAKRPTHINAYRVVEAALASGELTRSETCYGCGCSSSEHRIEAHHHDYSNPLAVIWLCVPCHRSLHVAIRKRVVA